MDKVKVQQIHVILVISEMQVCGYNSLKDKSKVRGDFWHDFR